MASLEGRVAVITGAAGAIGAAVARRYAAAGARIALVDVDAGGGERVCRELGGDTEHAFFECDLADLQACESVVRAVCEWAGCIDILVNAAAYLQRRPLADIDVEYWDRTVAINMAAPFFLARACAEHMSRRQWGRIILFSSQGAFTGGFNGSAVYAMSKAGVIALVKSLAREYAQHGITVNSIAPGGVDTPMLHSGMSAENVRAFVEKIPLGRLASPAEIAGACEFLISEDASYITGTTLDVNGGQLMR
jgi:3-oxoacyl-[acyl-carrier protein] reductase